MEKTPKIIGRRQATRKAKTYSGLATVPTEQLEHIYLGNESSPGGAVAEQEKDIMVGNDQLDTLLQELSAMRDTIAAQQAQIATLLSNQERAAVNDAPEMTENRVVRAPPMASFYGKQEERSSTRVKSFVYNLRKTGRLSGYNEWQMIELADCYLQDRAAIWMMGLERDGKKPRTTEELQEAMIREIVSQNELARAKTRLMKLKQTGTMENYISTFRDLVELCETPLSEAYLFFFNRLNDSFKEEFTKLYPTGEPKDFPEVFEHARTLDLARQWTTKSFERTVASGSKKRNLSRNWQNREWKDKPVKDSSNPVWGPAKP